MDSCSDDLSLDEPREHCGLVGVYNVPEAATSIYQGLFSIQHRGQEGAGIVVSDGQKVRSVKGLGLLSQVFAHNQLQALPGHIGLGHLRYSTTGSSSRVCNVQPLVAGLADGIWAIAHNGDLCNADTIRHAYQEKGAIFQTSTDSEILLHLLADPAYRSQPNRLAAALGALEGAFAYLIMTQTALMAARDPYGFRPLSIGRLGAGYVVASETCALDQVGATYWRDVAPGELVIIDEQGVQSFTFKPRAERLGQCIFEHVYFSRPDSVVFGSSVHKIRWELGRRLAQEAPVDADVVIPVPASGLSAAAGYAHESGIPFDFGFIRNPYVGRTFIMPESLQRADSVDLKLAIVAEVVRGQRVIVVDDSLIRGTTSRRSVAALRKSGVKEVHLRISCPPTAYPCHFGIDFPSTKELVAANKTLAEIRDYLGVDSLAYLSLDGLLRSVGDGANYCTGCYTGRYPFATNGHDKLALEKNQLTDCSEKGTEIDETNNPFVH